MSLTAQLDFGVGNSQVSQLWLPLTMPDADVAICHGFFDTSESMNLFTDLLSETRWRQDKIKLYGKELTLPRLTAWYGDPGKSYSYSGISMQPEPWTETLLRIKAKVDRAADILFNSVLISLYRTGQDSLSWHQDDEPELGLNPTIASVSFGDTRRFQFRHKYRKELSTVSVDLTNGSLLIMKGTTQQFWVHQLPKTAKPVEPRLNLTFRVIN